MNFKRTKDTLKNLEYKYELTLVDILGVFQDICDDLENEQEISLDELKIGDESKVVGKLLWIGQEVTGTLKANKKNLSDPGRVAKIVKQSDKLDAELEALEEAKDDVKKLQEQERELLRIQKEQEEQNRMKQRLIRECERLEEENSQCETVTIPELEKKKSNLEKKKGNLSETCKKLEEREEELTIDCDLVNTRIDEKLKNIEDIKKTIKENTPKIDTLGTEIEELTADLEVLNSRIGDLDSEKQDLIKKIKELDDNMKTMNIEVLRKRCEEKSKEYAELEKEANTIIGEENVVIANLKSLTKTMEEAKQNIEETTKEVNRLAIEKELKKKSLDEITGEKEMLETWFDGLECKKYDEEIQRALKRVDVLKKAKTILFQGIEKDLFLVEDNLEEKMRAFKEEQEVTFIRLQDELEALQKKYMSVSKAIYGGGDTLL